MREEKDYNALREGWDWFRKDISKLERGCITIFGLSCVTAFLSLVARNALGDEYISSFFVNPNEIRKYCEFVFYGSAISIGGSILGTLSARGRRARKELEGLGEEFKSEFGESIEEYCESIKKHSLKGYSK